MTEPAGSELDNLPARGDDELTPLRVWLHPRRTCHRLLQSLAETERTRKLYDMTEEEARKLRDDNLSLTSRLAESENARMRLESQLAQLKDDETYHEEMDRRLEEIEREFNKVEAMKRRYETTISTLKEKLRGANDELRRIAGQRDESIDLEAAYNPDAGSAYQRPSTRPPRTIDSLPPGARRRNHDNAPDDNREPRSPIEDVSAIPAIGGRPVIADGRGLPSREVPPPPAEKEPAKDKPASPANSDSIAASDFAPRRLDGTEWIPPYR